MNVVHRIEAMACTATKDPLSSSHQRRGFFPEKPVLEESSVLSYPTMHPERFFDFVKHEVSDPLRSLISPSK